MSFAEEPETAGVRGPVGGETAACGTENEQGVPVHDRDPGRTGTARVSPAAVRRQRPRRADREG
ncbi:hypothetical protein GCM10010340_28230 [Streptomyces griseoloalbus]|nr:hypothetical protein GCM10010340_28230 [Streptomyces albaduncus]